MSKLSPKLYKMLDNLYTDPSNPASFSSPQALYDEAKHIKGITKKIVNEYLHSKHSYTRFKIKHKTKPKRKIIAWTLDETWQMDLFFFNALARFNSGFKVLLLVCDVLSGMLFGEPLKDKRSVSVSEGIERILERAYPRKPKMVHSDKGLEFYASSTKEALQKHGIKLYSTQTGIKAAVVERKGRIVKEKLYRLMTENQNWRWVNFLQDVLNSINNKISRVHGFKPSEITKANQGIVFAKKYKISKKIRTPKFTVGTYCRIKMETGDFGRGFRPRFSADIFKISKVSKTNPPTYSVSAVDKTGKSSNLINRTFYESEIVKVTSPNFEEQIKDPPIQKRLI